MKPRNFFVSSNGCTIKGKPLVFTPKQMQRFRKRWWVEYELYGHSISTGPPEGVIEKEPSEALTYVAIGAVAFIAGMFFGRK